MKRTQKLLCMGLFSKKLSGPPAYGSAWWRPAVPGDHRFLPPEPNIRTLKRGGGDEKAEIFGSRPNYCRLRSRTTTLANN